MSVTVSVLDSDTGKYLPFKTWKEKYNLKSNEGRSRVLRQSWKVEKHERRVKDLGARCMGCGYGEFVECLDLHHIVSKKKGGKDSPENLLLLCCNCHFAFHRGRIELSDLLELKRRNQGYDDKIILNLRSKRWGM